MDYTKQILGKSIRDLFYEDIVTYFLTDRKESELVEFKSFSPKGSEAQNWDPMLKGVCAFLNSAGGVLIWGAPKGVSGPGKEKVFEGQLTSIDRTFEKDMVVSKISSSIIPLASDFKIELLKSNDGKQVCVIEINESQYKPHQFQHIYYMRLDGQSRPAPHYYVEALFKRVAIPNLEGFLKIEQPTMANDYKGNRYVLFVSVIIANFSSTQNEENVFYKLTNNVTRWAVDTWNENSNPKPLIGMKGAIHTDALSILANGTPFLRKYRFEFTREEITKSPNVLFTLQFGGKKSPPKFSWYKLAFNPTTQDLTPIEQSENASVGEHEDGDMSRETQLRDIFRG